MTIYEIARKILITLGSGRYPQLTDFFPLTNLFEFIRSRKMTSQSSIFTQVQRQRRETLWKSFGGAFLVLPSVLGGLGLQGVLRQLVSLARAPKT
jgi:hypothetical protein